MRIHGGTRHRPCAPAQGQGMFVGFSHAFVEWFVTLVPEHELLYEHDATAIVAAGFNALVVFSIVLLWRVRQRAKPLIVTYLPAAHSTQYDLPPCD